MNTNFNAIFRSNTCGCVLLATDILGLAIITTSLILFYDKNINFSPKYKPLCATGLLLGGIVMVFATILFLRWLHDTERLEACCFPQPRGTNYALLSGYPLR
jgi:hypothetical protein